MSKNPSASSSPAESTERRHASRWRALVDGYRYLNIATHHTLGALLKLLIVAYFIFCALFLSLRYAVLPSIDQYKGRVEQVASEALGRPVSIGALSASWRGLLPHLSLDQVVIHDKDGGRALVLPNVSATVSWWSVLVADLRLQRLEINRPDMDIQRDAQGNLYIAGILVDTQNGDSGQGADWVLSQRNIVIRDGRVRWNDVQRGAPELVLTDVNLVLHNQWRHHQFSLRATPPAAFAAPLDVRADFEHPRLAAKISDVSRWTGDVYVGVQNTDLAVWKTYIDYPIELMRGQGAVRAWLTFYGPKVVNFTADLTLTDVSTRLGKDLQVLNLQRVNGRISAEESIDTDFLGGTPTFGKNGHTVAVTNFSFETKDGLVFPATTISEQFIAARKGVPEQILFKADLLDLQTIAKFAGHLPFPAVQRKILADFAPRGQLKDFSAQWQGSYPHISAYKIHGQFLGLSMNALLPRKAQPASRNQPGHAALPSIPGFENLSGSVDATERGGSFQLTSTNLKFFLPAYFQDPVMPFDQLSMQANWTFQKQDRLLLQVDKMNFVQGGMAGSLIGSHLMPLTPHAGDLAGTANYSGHLSAFEVNKINSYLPLQTPTDLREWLVGALEAGKARDVAIKLKGDLAHFPFRTSGPNDKPKGEFRITARIEDGRLNYVPDEFGEDGKSPLWPVLEDINGRIVLDSTRLEVHADSGKTLGVGVSEVKAVVADLFADDILLEIDGRASGALQKFVDYTKASPVANWIDYFTDETKAGGNATLALKLRLPLSQLLETKVQGELQFSNNEVRLQPAIPTMSAVNGRLEFNETGVNLPAIKATFLGAPLTVSGGSKKDGTIVIKADGGVTADGLRRSYTAPAMQRVLQRISGATRYAVSIQIKDKHPEIVVDSSLQGLGFNFPAPLRKLPNEAMPLKVVWATKPVAETHVAPVLLQDEIKLSLGSTISALYQRQKSTEKNAAWSVARGGIGINVPAPQPDSGVTAHVNLKTLNVDTWSDLVSTIIGSDRKSAAPDALNIAQYIPDVLAARTAELIIADRPLDNVVVGASYQNGVWQANIDSQQVSGYVTWNESLSGRGPGKATARLTSLIIPQSAASGVSDLLTGKSTSTQIPALDVVAENFELFGKKFGRLEVVASNAWASGVREWRIRKLSLLNPDAELTANGKWSIKDGENLSSLDFALEIFDAGKFLDRFGFEKVARGGKGKMSGDIQWKGLPYSLDIPSLSGQFNMNLSAGQILKVDPSAAKLLSVLSLQALPRRLLLDFRDVFAEGFSFDSIVGGAAIDRGILKTDNLKMRSVSVTVLMDGTVDLAKESQNLHVVVLPEINAGAASVIYGLAVNPVIGLGSFLAQLFLREPLMRAFTSEYQITGTWKDPVTTKLDTKADKATESKPVSAAKPNPEANTQ